MRIEDALAKLRHAADLAAARGSLVFHIDLATVVAEDALAQQGVGYATLAVLVDEHGYHVVAFNDAARPDPVAEVSYDMRGQPQVGRPSAIPARASTFAAARRIILSTAFASADRHAAIVIPATESTRPVEGYAIAVGRDADDIRLDGHWRVTLDPDGGRISDREPLIVASAPVPAQQLRNHPLRTDAATPNEMHSYLSLKHGIPLTVETTESGLKWRVDGERTSLIGRP